MLDVVFWDRLFGQSRASAPASPKMANVEFVGSFMLIQFYDGHLCLIYAGKLSDKLGPRGIDAMGNDRAAMTGISSKRP
jgi:hypothetical protein